MIIKHHIYHIEQLSGIDPIYSRALQQHSYWSWLRLWQISYYRTWKIKLASIMICNWTIHITHASCGICHDVFCFIIIQPHVTSWCHDVMMSIVIAYYPALGERWLFPPPRLLYANYHSPGQGRTPTCLTAPNMTHDIWHVMTYHTWNVIYHSWHIFISQYHTYRRPASLITKNIPYSPAYWRLPIKVRFRRNLVFGFC